MVNRVYFIGQDNLVHNISDFDYRIKDERTAYIGKDCGEEGFRVDDEVNILTLNEAFMIVFD